MMKILHITPFYKPAYLYGGPIASVSKLCESQVDIGTSVYVLTTNANGKRANLNVDSRSFIEVDGVPVHYFPSVTNDNTFISLSLWKYLFRHGNEYDLIHIHTWWNFLVLGSTIISKIKGLNVVLSPRGMLSEYIFQASNSRIKMIIHNLIGKRLLRFTTFNATSTQEYQECKRLISDWNGFTLPNILDLPDVSIKRKKTDKFTLLFFSRIHPKKGIELLFYALAQSTNSYKLKIAGTGDLEYIQSLKELALELKISCNIEWLGWISPHNKYVQLLSADVFVLTSFNENFANVVIESLHVGTPVLISENVGLSTFVEQENLGWVTDLSISNIAYNIREAFYDKKKIERINLVANGIVSKHFSPSILSSLYLKEYSKAISKAAH